MIKYTDIMPISFLKMESFTGSAGGIRGLRYKLEKKEVIIDKETGEKKTFLAIHTWQGPFAFDKIPEEQLRTKNFEFSEEGRRAGIDYLNNLIPEYNNQ